MSLFVIAASVTRRTEVHAFLKYTLGLALLCALGVIWEYRFNLNVFHMVSDALLPGAFTVADAGAGGVDASAGGPSRPGSGAARGGDDALHGAADRDRGVMSAGIRRARIRNVVAACIIMAAVIATYRKTGLIAPWRSA